MKDIVREYQEQFRRHKLQLRRYTALLLALALVTTLFVNWQLHSDGIAITADYKCGEIEHQHTADCYEKVLICGYEEGEPEDWNATMPDDSTSIDESFGVDAADDSDFSTYPAEPEYIFVPHEHTEECYQEVQTLTCFEEEHVHTDDCFDPEDGSLICDLFEHTHDESCYTTEYELVCGLEEGELVEELNPDYSPVAMFEEPIAAKPVVIEPVVEAPVHHHTDDCYEEVLICGLPEHHHTVNCLADPYDDIEDEADWLSKTDTSLDGLWTDDLLSVAKSQLDYEQSEKNFQLDTDDGVTVRHYTRYGQWYGNPYGAWDVMFLSYCLNYANIPQSVIPQRAGTLALRSELRGSEYMSDFAGDMPIDAVTPGDIVFYQTTTTETVAVDNEQPQIMDDSPDADIALLAMDTTESAPQTEERTITTETVGIVSEVDYAAGTLTVISGDVDGKVAEVSLTAPQVTALVSVASAQAGNDGSDTLVSDTKLLTPTEDKYDFTQDITSVDLSYRKNSSDSWSKITSDSYVDENDEIQASMKYTLPAYTLSSICNTITYPLPDALNSFTEEGVVYDTDGNAVGYGKVENGQITITFYDDYVKKNAEGSVINGSLTFSGKAEEVKIPLETETEIKFNDKCSSVITINQGKDQMGDIHTQKSYSDYDLENGTVKYTVKVWSNHGTADNEIELDDTMKNFVLDTAQGITVVKSDGSTETISDFAYKDGNTGFTGKLPALKAGEYYELTYWGKLPDDLKGGNVTASNTIYVESKNNRGDKIDSSATVDTGFTNVKKSGVNNGDGTISWTVTLNDSHTDLNGWTLKDELNGQAYTGTVHIVPSSGPAFDAELPYKFGSNGEDTTSSFTITYTTTDDHDYGTSQVSNKATLTNDKGGEMGSGDSGVYVGNKDAYFKDCLGSTPNADGTLTLDWHIKLIIHEDVAAGWMWKDQPYTSGQYSQYFTPAQREQLAKQLDEILGAGNYKLGEMYNGYTPEGNWETLRIEGLTDLKAGTVLEFNISTTVSGIPDVSTDFTNNAYFNNTNFKGDYHYTPNLDSIVKKFDNKQDGSVTDHDYHDSNATLQWRVEVTMSDAFLASMPDYITITDTIPAGLEFQTIGGEQLSGAGCWNSTGTTKNSDTDWTVGTWYWNTSTSPTGSTGAGAPVKVTITENPDGSHSMVLTIPKELYQTLAADSKIKLIVTAKITDDPTKWDSTQKNFTNTVSVTDSDLKDWGSADQTQEVSYNKHHDDVQKSAEQVDSNEASNTVEYSIIVNPNGTDILDDPNIKLTLVDEMRYNYDPWNDQVTVFLVPSSVKVYHYDETTSDHRGDELSLSEYSYVYEMLGYGDETTKEERTNRLTFTLPNSEPLVVVYRYRASSPRTWDISPTLSNTATLYANKKVVTSSTVTTQVRVTNSTWGADITGITVYKVDKDNYGLHLPDAKFSLYAWNDTDWELVTDQLITDSDGKLIEAGTGKSLSTVMSDKQTYNQAYKLVETQAPSGYQLPAEDDAYLFYLPSNNTKDYPKHLPQDLSAFHLHSSGQNILLTNERNDSPSYELPSTGGAGTTLYTTVGGAIALAALVCGVCQKRRRERRAH